VYIAPEVFNLSGIRVGWYSEYCLEVTDPPALPALEIPIPRYRPSGFNSQAKAVVADS
jgi:hypothetical protein